MVVGHDSGRFIFAKLFCELSGTLSKAKIRLKAFKTTQDAEAWLDEEG